MNDNVDRDIYLVQNPSISGAAIWRFIASYYSEGNNGVPFPLIFLVLPIVFRTDICEIINSTHKTSSLQKVSEKLFNDGSSNYRNDLLFYVNNAAAQYKNLTLTAIGVAINAKLISLEPVTALMIPLTQIKKGNLPKTAQSLLSAADKLGFWCSKLSLHEISSILKVRF